MGARILRLIIIGYILVLGVPACGPFPQNNNEVDAGNTTDIDLPEGPVSNVLLDIHPQVETIVVVNWTQDEEADFAWIEFTFENDEWFASPKKPGDVGDHTEVVLGVPEATPITIRIANEIGDSVWRTDTFQGTNGYIPENMPIPTLIEYAPSLASDHGWLLGSVENTVNVHGYWESPYYAYIIDRQGRIVWYYNNPLDSRILFSEVAKEGTHITFDESLGFIFDGAEVLINKASLDFEYHEQIIVNDMTWGHDITDDGDILYDDFGILKEMGPDGGVRTIFDCQAWLPGAGWPGPWSDCFSNTISWCPARDSVNLSLPWDVHTVLEIDRQTGVVLSQWGGLIYSWEFEPKDIAFDFQHYPNITEDGTLLVSSHVPGVPDQQNIMEFEIDDENQVLRLIWTYGEGIGSYADQSGEATRISNGNTLINYGTGGVIREVTPDKETAWHVLFDADFVPTTDNKLLGHTVLIDDLYELNQGQ